jgi:tetratricopeptide (TPR) repeat protein
MPKRLQNIRNFSVRIEAIEPQKGTGTGFVISSDGQVVHILTAAHVVTRIFGANKAVETIGNLVNVNFHQVPEGQRCKQARIIKCFLEYDDDVVLLELIGGDPRARDFQDFALIGAADYSIANPYFCFGFPIKNHPYWIVDGTILGLIPGDIPGDRCLDVPISLRSNSLGAEITEGMSGAAVLDIRRNLVVGIVMRVLREKTSISQAVNCKVLAFEPFQIDLIQEAIDQASRNEAEPSFVRSEFINPDRVNIYLDHAPKDLLTWVGREEIIQEINRSWLNPDVKVVQLVGFGGEGKTSTAKKWLDLFLEERSNNKPKGVFWWNFYKRKSVDDFLEELCAFIIQNKHFHWTKKSQEEKLNIIKSELTRQCFVLILDGFEVMQYQNEYRYGDTEDKNLYALIEFLASVNHKSFCLITTRVPLTIGYYYLKSCPINHFSLQEGTLLLKHLGINGTDYELQQTVKKWNGHPLTLTLLGTLLRDHYNGDILRINEIPAPFAEEPQYERVKKLLYQYDAHLSVNEHQFLHLFSAIRSSMSFQDMYKILKENTEAMKNLSCLDLNGFNELLKGLVRRKIIYEANRPEQTSMEVAVSESENWKHKYFSIHPLVREYFYNGLSQTARQEINLLLRDFVKKIPVPKRPRKVEQLQPAIDEVYYLCEAGRHDEAYDVYYNKVSRSGELALDSTGYLTTVLCAYQTDLEIQKLFFEDHDTTKEPVVNRVFSRINLLFVSDNYSYLGRVEESIALNKRAALEGIKIGDADYSTWAYQNLAVDYASIGKLKESEESAIFGLSYALKITHRASESIDSYMRIAWVNFLMGNYQKSLDAVENAKKVSEQNPQADSYRVDIEGLWLAEIFLRTGDIPGSQNVITENKLWYKKADLSLDAGWWRLSGQIAQIQKKYKAARNFFDKAVQTAEKQGVREEILRSLHWRAEFYMNRADLEHAASDLDRALEIAITSGYLWKIDVEISQIKLKLRGSFNKQALALERKKLIEIRERAIDANYRWAEGDALDLLSNIETLSGNKEKAQETLQQALCIRQEIHAFIY